MSKENSFPEGSAFHQLQNGIFSFVIQLCQKLEAQTNDPEGSREWVASYLEEIAYGLRELNEKEANE